MGKQLGTLYQGCIGNVVAYVMNGRGYLRSKSSLTRKRVLKSKAFEKTRKYASDFVKAAKLGSAIYRELPAIKRTRSVYQKITGEAASLLYEGRGEAEVRQLLFAKYIQML